MEWLRENWFFILFLIIFVAIHLFGHGGCGGHRRGDKEEDEGHHGKDASEKKGGGGCH